MAATWSAEFARGELAGAPFASSLASSRLVGQGSACQLMLRKRRIDPDYGFGPLWLYATPISAFVLALMLRRWTPQASWWRRLIAAIATPVLALWLSFQADAWSSFYYSDIEEDAESAVAERADAALDYDPEDLLALQDGLVDAQIAALLPQRPGQVDLYLVAMAGDGAEDVFRNEVVLATTAR